MDDECGQHACSLQMLQHVAERRLGHSPMHPDPSVVRWDQLPAAGALVSGSLSVFLDPEDAKSPKLELEVEMHFADQQPAPLGPLLLHCGGPGSGSSCVRYAPWSRNSPTFLAPEIPLPNFFWENLPVSATSLYRRDPESSSRI